MSHYSCKACGLLPDKCKCGGIKTVRLSPERKPEKLGPYFKKSNIRDANDSLGCLNRLMDRGLENLDHQQVRSAISQATQLTAALNRLLGMMESEVTR